MAYFIAQVMIATEEQQERLTLIAESELRLSNLFLYSLKNYVCIPVNSKSDVFAVYVAENASADVARAFVRSSQFDNRNVIIDNENTTSYDEEVLQKNKLVQKFNSFIAKGLKTENEFLELTLNEIKD